MVPAIKAHRVTRWQVFGGRYDGYRIDTTHDDQAELTTHARILNQQKLTVRDIDLAGHALTITIPATSQEQPHD